MVTITPSERFTTYAPVVPTTEFPVGFPIFDPDDVKLLLDGEEVTGITVTATFIEGMSTNAVINVMGAGIVGEVLVVGARDPRRTDQYQNGRPLQIADHNYSLNRLTIENQEQRRDLERALKMPIGSPDIEDFPLPGPGKLVGWNEDGTALENKDILPSTGLIAGFTGLQLLASGTVAAARAVLDLVPGAFGFVAFKWNTLAEAIGILGIREKLTANRTYYVRPGGNDNNNGLTNSDGGAFRTINKARRVIWNTLDLNGFTVTVVLVSNLSGETVYCYGPVLGGSDATPSVRFIGNAGAPDSVAVPGGFQARGGARIAVHSLNIDPAGADTYCLYSRGTGSYIEFGDITFGQCGPNTDHIIATDGGSFLADTPYRIRGGALNHYHVTEGSVGRVNAMNIDCSNGLGAPGAYNFPGQFAGVASSVLTMIGVTYNLASAITGKTYLVHYNGVIRAGLDTRNVFPGNAHGFERTGGRLDSASTFSAHKNGPDQVIANGAWVKLTMPALAIHLGGDYNTVTSSWNPRGGEVQIMATVTFTTVAAVDQIIGLSIFKNGVEWKSVLGCIAGGLSVVRSLSLTEIDAPNGSDVYELYARGGNTGNSTVSGSSAWTHWSGRQY